MKYAVILLAALLATPGIAQTSNDDTPSIENWWDEVGADFFGEATLLEPRPETEIRAQWTGLSDDDRRAVLARCAAPSGEAGVAALSLQEGDEDENPNTTPAELTDQNADAGRVPATDPADEATTTTGSVGGTEIQSASRDATPAPDTGLAGQGLETDDVAMVRICDLVPTL